MEVSCNISEHLGGGGGGPLDPSLVTIFCLEARDFCKYFPRHRTTYTTFSSVEPIQTENPQINEFDIIISFLIIIII